MSLPPPEVPATVTAVAAEPIATEAAAAEATCALCANPLAGSTATVNMKPLCAACHAKLKAELAAEVPSGSDLPMAIVGGAVGAIASAAAWASIEVATSLRIGFVAVGVGWLVGVAMKLGAGKARGGALQPIAAAWSIVGLILARYFAFAYTMKQGLSAYGIEIGYFNGQILTEFSNALGELVSPFDLLWLFLAVTTAWSALKPSRVVLDP